MSSMPEGCRRAWRILLAGHARGGWKCWAAAAPLFFLAWASWLALPGRHEFPGLSRSTITRAMMAEFLITHSFGFLGLLVLRKVETAAEKIVKWSLFLLLMAGYCAMSLQEGWDMLLMFCMGGGVTYLGVLLNLHAPDQLKQLVARWVFCFCAYIFSIFAAGTPGNVNSWEGKFSVVQASVLYSMLLALAELSGAYYLQAADFLPWLTEAADDAERLRARKDIEPPSGEMR